VSVAKGLGNSGVARVGDLNVEVRGRHGESAGEALRTVGSGGGWLGWSGIIACRPTFYTSILAIFSLDLSSLLFVSMWLSCFSDWWPD
jgi:hypothetical protein